jgi:transcriptional repressor NrdR
MVCPFCLHKKTDVYNTRGTAKGVWRRRRCLNCGKAFTTQEHFDPSGTWKVMSGKKIAPYSRATLSMSILRACDHRADQDDAAWYLFEIAEQNLTPSLSDKQTVTTADIIKVVATLLKRFDTAAYVKYISYHQPAMDAKTLRKHLRRG